MWWRRPLTRLLRLSLALVRRWRRLMMWRLMMRRLMVRWLMMLVVLLMLLMLMLLWRLRMDARRPRRHSLALPRSAGSRRSLLGALLTPLRLLLLYMIIYMAGAATARTAGLRVGRTPRTRRRVLMRRILGVRWRWWPSCAHVVRHPVLTVRVAAWWRWMLWWRPSSRRRWTSAGGLRAGWRWTRHRR